MCRSALGSIPFPHLPWDVLPCPPHTIGASVKEETRRHPETGLFTLQSELMVTPARGGAPRPTFSCSFSPSLPRRRALHTAPFQLTVWGEGRGGEGPKLRRAHSESVALREGRVKPMATGTTHRCNSTSCPFPPPEPVPLKEVQLMVEPEGGAVAPGSTVTLTCEAPAQPPPQIHWIDQTKMSDNIPSSSKF